jgi:transcriptional regulator NrdR family protein
MKDRDNLDAISRLVEGKTHMRFDHEFLERYDRSDDRIINDRLTEGKGRQISKEKLAATIKATEEWELNAQDEEEFNRAHTSLLNMKRDYKELYGDYDPFLNESMDLDPAMARLFEASLGHADKDPEDRESLDASGQAFIVQAMKEIAEEVSSLKVSKKVMDRLLRIVEISYRNGHQTTSKQAFEDALYNIHQMGDWAS